MTNNNSQSISAALADSTLMKQIARMSNRKKKFKSVEDEEKYKVNPNSVDYEILDSSGKVMQKVKAPGNFGFGGGRGELFGEGGLAFGIADPLVGGVVNGIVNPLSALVQTSAKTTGDILGGKSFADALTNPANAIENQQPLLTGKFGPNQLDWEDKFKNYAADPIRSGLKEGASILSYATPGLGGKGAGVISNAATRGLPGGALMGFGQSEKGQELPSTLLGGLTGFGVDAGLGLVGKALKSVAGKSKPNLQAQYSDILNAPELAGSSGLKKGSAKPFNNALNKLSSQINNIDDPAQKQLVDNFAKRIKPAVDAGLSDAKEVMGAMKMLYGVDDKLLGAKAFPKGVIQKADLSLPAVENAKLLQDTLGRQLLGEMPRVERNAIKDTYKRLGFTTREVGAFADKFKNDVSSMETARRFFGEKLDADGLSNTFSKLKDLQTTSLDQVGTVVQVNPTQVSKALGDQAYAYAGKGAFGTNKEASSAISVRLTDLMTRATGNVDVRLNNTGGVYPSTLQNIKDAVTDGYLKVVKGIGTPQRGDIVDSQIYNWAKQKVNESTPGMSGINKALETMYTQFPGVRRVVDTGATTGERTASVLQQGPLGALVDKAGGLITQGAQRTGEIIRGAGNLAGKLGEAIPNLPEPVGNIAQAASSMIPGITNTVAPALAGMAVNQPELEAAQAQPSSILDSINNNPDMGGEDYNSGIPDSTELWDMYNALPEDQRSVLTIAQQLGGKVDARELQKQMMGGNNKQQPQSYAAILQNALAATGGDLNSALKLASFLGQDLEAQNAAEKTTSGRPLSAAIASKMSEGLSTANNFGAIEELLTQNENQFGSASTSRLSDLGGIFANADREGLKSQLNNLASEIVKYYSGAAASDNERANLMSQLPQVTDELPVAKRKLELFKKAFSRRLATQSQTLQSAGFDSPTNIADFAATLGM